jgi:peptidoglycan/xylan/chitin deacetylase (PgdA/CDA1 family)/O-antigen ligase
MTASATSKEMAPTPKLDRADLVGLALVAAAVLWTFVAATSGGDAWPIVGVYVLAGAAYAVGRVGGRTNPLLVPLVVVAVSLLLGLLWLVGALSQAADAAPLGYENARSAFFVEAAAAAVTAAALIRRRAARLVGLVVAAFLAAQPILSGSGAASIVVLLLPAAAAIALAGRKVAISVAASALALVIALGSTTWVAAARDRSNVVQEAEDVLGERRIALWRNAMDLMVEHPLTGVGPGRFAAEAPTAQIDRDARWAHHGFLQQGAETGVVGLALLVLLFLWGFWRLASLPSTGAVAMGAFALGALGVMACSDYVLHFPLLTGVAAALVGTASAGPRRAHELEPSRLGGRAEAMLDAGLRRSPLQPIFLWRAERKLSVLAYHGVDQPDRFMDHLAYLRRYHHPTTLADVVETVRGRRGLPPRAVLVTFDDGDRTVLDLALPALRSMGIPAVAFVVAGLLDTDEPFWWEEVDLLVSAGARLPEPNGQGPAHAVRFLKRVPDLRRRRLIEELRRQRPDAHVRRRQLRRAELAVLERGGIAVGNHSLTHPCLGRCSDGQVRVEIEEAHAVLESVLGHHPQAFAYPDGDWDGRAWERLRHLDYPSGFLFDHRASSLPVEDPLRISRLRVNAGTSMDRFRTILSGLHPAIHSLRTRAASGGRV